MSASINIERHGRVAIVELNRPDALNAIDSEMRQTLARELDRIGRDDSVGAVVLAGVGKSFCAGADLKSAAAIEDTSTRRVARMLTHEYQPLLETIARMDKPVIAAVQGAGVGVGMSIVLTCDLMLMAEGSYLMSPFIKLGLTSDGGAAWLLTRRLGHARAMEILLEAEKIEAARCLELGLANRVVAAEALRADALEWATTLAARPPIAVALTKRLVRMAPTASLSESLTMEAEFQSFCAATEDTREAIAAFAEKRAPVFKGR